MLAAATLSRFVFFTRYIASSAMCRSSTLVLESTGYEATPTLAVISTLPTAGYGTPTSCKSILSPGTNMTGYHLH
jgi:hypothetical protein